MRMRRGDQPTMNRLFLVLMAMMLVAVVPIASRAQDNSSSLTQLGEDIVRAIQEQRPNWTYEAVSPIAGNDGVIIQKWTSGQRIVRIAIVAHRSVPEAARLMLDLARDHQPREVIPGLCDEGFSWGRGTVTFRKRHLSISVSAVNTDTQVSVSRLAEQGDDERALCREFARLVADVVRNRQI